MVVSNITNQSMLSATKIDTAVSLINPLIIKIIVAILILLLGIIVGKIIQKLFMKLFDLMELNKLLYKSTGIKIQISNILSAMAEYFIYILSLIFALNTLGITGAIINAVVVVILIVVVFFIVFGANDLFANVFAGLIIKFRKNIKIGDYIKIRDAENIIEGHIIAISSVNIRLETGKDEIVFVPNVLLIKSEITKPKNPATIKNRKKN